MSTPSSAPSQDRPDVTIRPLREHDLPAADRIMRFAFGTYLGMPDPIRFMGDADYIRTRWLADPTAALAAEFAGALAGTNFATRWGSVAFFGPLTILPELWGRGIAQRLLGPTMDLFDQWGVRHSGLFTFAESAKHVSLYQKFGFWPRFLTALMERPVAENSSSVAWTRFGELTESEKPNCLQACRELTDSIYEGLDVEREIRAVDAQHLGDTVLTWDGGRLAGFAVCHTGAGTEAGSEKCYIKFAAVRCGPYSTLEFRRLLAASGEFGVSRGTKLLTAGMNSARLDAYREMLQAGFRSTRQGVVMERHGKPGYNRREVFLIDDWR